MAIDWDSVLAYWNHKNDDQYSNIVDLMYDLYIKNKSTSIVADILGVSQTTIWKILKDRIKSRDRGFYIKKFEEMVSNKGLDTILSKPNKDLSKAIGCSEIWIAKMKQKKRCENGNI